MSRHHQERIKSDVSEASFPFQAYPMFLFFFLKKERKRNEQRIRCEYLEQPTR